MRGKKMLKIRAIPYNRATSELVKRGFLEIMDLTEYYLADATHQTIIVIYSFR